MVEQKLQIVPEEVNVTIDHEYSEIFSTLEGLNTDNLRRKSAFSRGQDIISEKEYTDENQKVLSSFKGVPDVLPIKGKDPATQFNWGTLDQKVDFMIKENLEYFESIKGRKIRYDKPICIIYNPVSGKKTNLVPRIEERLNAEKILYKFLPTQKAQDTYTYARDLPIDEYSIIVAAGGDGSYHEVINGMLARPDGKKLPIAMIPNGSGNDLCTSIGIMNLNDALDYIVQATAVRFDTIKVMCDYEDESKVPNEGNERLLHCRHMDVNGCMSMPAKINHQAIPFKKCFGKCSYQIATMKLACSCNFTQDMFDVELDDVKVTSVDKETLNTLLVFITNGKFTGGGMIINPYSCMNDGLLALSWAEDPQINSLVGIAKGMDKAKKGAVHAYDGTFRFKRGKKLKISFLGRLGKNNENRTEQMIAIDGESMFFRDYCVFEACPDNVEYLFDATRYFKEHESFKQIK